MAWRLGPRNAQATLQRRLLTGLPTTSGRHGGCRLLIGPSGALVVGTGDAAVGTNPRNRASLGGKTLRLNRFSGRPWPSNPFIRSDTLRTRYLLTFGHRNVQGLAVRANGQLWSVEHGSDRDDEVNRLVPGRRLRLEPGAGLRRERADDRPEPAGTRRSARVGGPARPPWRRPAPPS